MPYGPPDPDGFPQQGVQDVFVGAGAAGAFEQPGPGEPPIAREVPWSGNEATVKKIAHFRGAAAGPAMFSGQTRYITGGVSPSMSQYNTFDEANSDDGLNHAISYGNNKYQDPLPLSAPTTTRQGRVSAVRNSSPASAFFQGYFQTRWSGVLAGFGLQNRPVIIPGQPGSSALHANWAPTLPGTKELHKATQFNPFPPMGSIVPPLTLEPKVV